MSKIKNGGLDQYGAEPFEQQQFGTAGVEGVKRCDAEVHEENPRAAINYFRQQNWNLINVALKVEGRDQKHFYYWGLRYRKSVCRL